MTTDTDSLKPCPVGWCAWTGDDTGHHLERRHGGDVNDSGESEPKGGDTMTTETEDVMRDEAKTQEEHSVVRCKVCGKLAGEHLPGEILGCRALSQMPDR